MGRHEHLPFFMKLYYKNDRPLVKKHKNLIKAVQEKTNLSDYQLLWATFAKGLLIGIILL